MPQKRENSLSEQEQQDLASIRQRPSRIRPKSVGSIVRRLMSQRGYGQTQLNDQLLTAWQVAAGERLASVSRVGKVTRGVLSVSASGSAAVQEIHFAKRKILRDLAKHYPELGITDLRIGSDQ